MATYLIHACPDRMWYVMQFIVPSMKEQGITDIRIACDNDHVGNLESYMQSFKSMKGDGGIWHMNDDIIISRQFRTMTEFLDEGIVCGFTCMPTTQSGFVKPVDMWWSFPCIRIPNKLARECAEWFYAIGRHQFPDHAATGREDDWFFKEFLKANYPDIEILNLRPCLVDHIDYLIGGSSLFGWCNQYRAKYFDDQDLVDDLEQRIKLVKSKPNDRDSR